MANVLSPVQLKSMNLRHMDAKRHAEIAGPDTPDDHVQLREMRRRILDIVHEFAEKGIF